MSAHLALIIWDWWEGHCSISCVCCCFNNSPIFFLQFKAVFSSFKSFSFKNFLSSKSYACWACWSVNVLKYKIFCFFWSSCFQFSCTYFFNFYFNFLNSCVVCNSWFISSNFWNCILVSSHLALIVWDWCESNTSVSCICYCFDNTTVFFLQDKAVFSSFKSFSFKNFLSTKSYTCSSCWSMCIGYMGLICIIRYNIIIFTNNNFCTFL